ncbi:DVU3141 family protein [Alkalilimnicola ehrlichii]|uniref:DVU3141 family protein n=1 Tax=Alkalilimnicola ehrlichii TaxID=351052 RepID=UPI0015F24AF4|nr:DVU3141 family protein [Alkalilimnicola ehrlichii]
MFAGLVIAGCAATPSQVSTASARHALPAAFQTMLDEEPVNSRAELRESPWGPDVSVRLHGLYDAASGRVCRRLTVEADGVRRPALACRSQDGVWTAVRVLHETGRPVPMASAESDGRRSAQP